MFKVQVNAGWVVSRFCAEPMHKSNLLWVNKYLRSKTFQCMQCFVYLIYLDIAVDIRAANVTG